jgi:hypothetical protein
MSTLNDIQQLEQSVQKLRDKIARQRDRLISIKGTDVTGEMRLEDEIAEHEALLADLQQQLSNHFRIGTPTSDNLLTEKLASFDEQFSDEVGVFHRVNMNRERMSERFFDVADELETETYQFYFITACPTQMPPSFAERLILEYVDEFLSGDDNSIRYPVQGATGRLQFEQLPQKRKLNRCQDAFKSFFAQFFGFSKEQDFDTFIMQGIPNLPEEYVCMVFEVEQTKWREGVTAEYLEWIVQTFSNPHEDVPKFLFFFVTYLQDMHLSDSDKHPIVQSLDQLEGNHQPVVHLKPLLPVAELDLRAWLRSIGIRNDANVETLIEIIIKGLKQRERAMYDSEKTFNMDDLELVQKIICDFLDAR